MTGAQVREQLRGVKEMQKALQLYRLAWDESAEGIRAAYHVAIVEIERLEAKLRGVLPDPMAESERSRPRAPR